MKVLYSICQQIWKTQQWPQDWKRSVFIPIPKKGNAKKCSNYHTIALISHASKVMLKILQARLQQYVNRELPDVQAGFRKGRGLLLPSFVTLYTRQQKRHWCIEQSFGLCGRGRGWDDLGEWHWNMYNIIYETSRQSRLDAWYWMLGAGALGWPRVMVWGGREEEGSGWRTHVYLWWIHFDIWQNQYNILKLKN